MTKLTYEWTNGIDTKVFNSYESVKHYIFKYGGKYKPIYETILDDFNYHSKAKRRSII